MVPKISRAGRDLNTLRAVHSSCLLLLLQQWFSARAEPNPFPRCYGSNKFLDPLHPSKNVWRLWPHTRPCVPSDFSLECHMDMPAHTVFFFFFFLQFPSAKRELECRALQVTDENAKNLKKKSLFGEHKYNVVYWLWVLCCTWGKWLFSPCTLLCQPLSLSEAVALGTPASTSNSFDFSRTFPNSSFLRVEMWPHQFSLLSQKPQAGLLSWLLTVTQTS